MELKRILLAEDSERDIELILTVLAKHNLANEVVVVRNGEEALNYLHRRGSFRRRQWGNPAVLLLDLKMPKVDGVEVLKALKSDPLLGLIPVVVLTSSCEEQDLISSYGLGASAYVVKPVDFQEFIAAIESLGLFWAIVNQPPPGTVALIRDRK